MTDHRRLQRALFRMQMDPAFAARVLSGDEAATVSLELASEDLALIFALDAAAVAADAGDRRKLQLQGNLASEYALSVAAGPEDLLARFLSAPEFHGAVARDELLPAAFGAYAARRAEEEGCAPLAALAELEGAMAALRRRRGAPAPGPAGVLRLAPRAALVSLPEGTLAFAAALGEGGALQAPALGPGCERVLLQATEAPAHALPDVRPERLSEPVALLLERAQAGLDGAGRRALAAQLGASAEELEAFAEALVLDGVLVRTGPAPAP